MYVRMYLFIYYLFLVEVLGIEPRTLMHAEHSLYH